MIRKCSFAVATAAFLSAAMAAAPARAECQNHHIRESGYYYIYGYCFLRPSQDSDSYGVCEWDGRVKRLGFFSTVFGIENTTHEKWDTAYKAFRKGLSVQYGIDTEDQTVNRKIDLTISASACFNSKEQAEQSRQELLAKPLSNEVRLGFEGI